MTAGAIVVPVPATNSLVETDKRAGAPALRSVARQPARTRSREAHRHGGWDQGRSIWKNTDGCTPMGIRESRDLL